MTRRLFTILSALSLLLCVAVCVLWVRSYWVGDDFVVRNPIDDGAISWQRVTDIRLGRGGIQVERVKLRVYTVNRDDKRVNELIFTIPPPPARSWEAADPEYPDFLYGDAAAGLAGFAWSRYDTGGGWLSVRGWGVIVPMWLPALLLTLPTAVTVRSRRRRKANARAGLCPQCGYDLRATPTRCPECGHVPAVKGAA
jgi:hypothetical protein